MTDNQEIIELLDTQIPELADIAECFRQCQPTAADELLLYYRQHLPTLFLEDTATVIQWLRRQAPSHGKAMADRLLQQTFVFDDPWDMEKCSVPVTFPREINWLHVEQGDEEWQFMLNRHHYLAALLQQRLITGDTSYYRQFEELLISWMTSEPQWDGRQHSSWRTIDTGIRLKHWIRLLDYLLIIDEFSSQLFVKLLVYIQRQAAYLMNQYQPELALSNWRILEFHGTTLAGLALPFLKDAGNWLQQSLTILTTCSQLQVTSDGFHWEQSFMYHHEVLLCLAEVVLLAQRNHYELPAALVAQVQAMAKASSHLVAPNGQQPCYGDSDVEQLEDLLTFVALLFPEESLGCFQQKVPTPFLMMMFGSAALKELPKLNQQPLPQLDFAHEAVGNYFLRSSWQQDANYLFFKNGFLGSGHGHCDLLHIDLMVRGIPVLIDSGRYTYKAADPLRQALKNANAHNTFLVDQQEFILQKGAWGTTRVTHEIKQPSVLNRPVVFVQGTHAGYLNKGILVNRKVIWLKPSIWLIVDSALNDGGMAHVYQQHFHFHKPQVTGDGKKFSYMDEEVQVGFYPLSPACFEKKRILVSPAYNQSKQTEEIVLTQTATNDWAQTTIIADESQHQLQMEQVPVYDMQRQLVSTRYTSAVRLSLGDEQWLVYVNHREEPGSRKLHMADGIQLYGRTVVAAVKPSGVDYHVLEY